MRTLVVAFIGVALLAGCNTVAGVKEDSRQAADYTYDKKEEYQRALAADPREPLVHNNLAVLLMAEGNLPAAEQELAAELTLHPGSPEAHENLARVRQALGKPP